jgi:hypothetical protein
LQAVLFYVQKHYLVIFIAHPDLRLEIITNHILESILKLKFVDPVIYEVLHLLKVDLVVL